MSVNAQPRKMPNKRQIYAYWDDMLRREDKYWTEPGEKHCCFACGYEGLIQRCHIVPRWQGGDDSPSNIHLLCKYCHEVSEGLTGEDYWAWFKVRKMADTLIAVLANVLGCDGYRDLKVLGQGLMSRNDYIEKYPHAAKWLDMYDERVRQWEAKDK